MVAAWIGAAYWFTASTSFANPAAAFGRMFSNSFAGIAPAGMEPDVIEYLKTPPSRREIRSLLAAMGMAVRQLLRKKEAPFAELGLNDAHWTDDRLLHFIGQHPILMNRPIVATPLGAKLCRPSEAVLELLPVGPLPSFTKEDGEVVTDDGARRERA